MDFNPEAHALFTVNAGNFLRHAAADGNLPRWIGTASGLPGAAEDSFLYLIGLDSGALDRRFGGHRAHVSRGQRRERSAEFADRRADGGENIDGLQGASKHLSLAGWERCGNAKL